jgi:5-methylcytosine-specific restriction endonuclease McrA
MQKHTRIYLDYFDFKVAEEVMCESCGRPAVDIHHIRGRGKGKDEIKNLIALCRKCHQFAHDNKITKEDVQLIHNYFLAGHRKQFVK